MPQEDVLNILADPLAQALLNSTLPVRLAYTGLDGFPRVVPVWFYWDGEQIVIGTHANAPKVEALKKNPKVALTIDKDTYPPEILLIRGTASVELVDEVVPEYLAAGRKYLDAEQAQGFEAYAREAYKHMARISITPEWAKILDFQTRFPRAIEEQQRGSA